VGGLLPDKKAYRKRLFGVAGTVSAATSTLSYLMWLL